MTKICRGAAHCRTSHCGLRGRVIPLSPFSADYVCTGCSKPAAVEAEFGAGLGASRSYNDVRVYFGFDTVTRTYTDSVRAADPTLVGMHSTYAFFSPLVIERSEALKLAEMLLARLNTRPTAAKPLSASSSHGDLLEQGWSCAS